MTTSDDPGLELPGLPLDDNSGALALLALPMGDNDAGAPTVRHYLHKLLATVWDEEEGFSGKRPFGNSGWQDDVYESMVAAGMVSGKLDGDGCLEEVDGRDAGKLILSAIAVMCGVPEEKRWQL